MSNLKEVVKNNNNHNPGKIEYNGGVMYIPSMQLGIFPGNTIEKVLKNKQIYLEWQKNFGVESGNEFYHCLEYDLTFLNSMDINEELIYNRQLSITDKMIPFSYYLVSTNQKKEEQLVVKPIMYKPKN